MKGKENSGNDGRLLERLRNVKVVGKMPSELSTEMLLQELDPEKKILSEEERSLIQDYAVQMKDMIKTRELAERISGGVWKLG